MVSVRSEGGCCGMKIPLMSLSIQGYGLNCRATDALVREVVLGTIVRRD